MQIVSHRCRILPSSHRNSFPSSEALYLFHLERSWISGRIYKNYNNLFRDEILHMSSGQRPCPQVILLALNVETSIIHLLEKRIFKNTLRLRHRKTTIYSAENWTRPQKEDLDHLQDLLQEFNQNPSSRKRIRSMSNPTTETLQTNVDRPVAARILSVLKKKSSCHSL